ncbi:MAG: ADP-ribosylglycohydrolase family protein [Anaerolineales bacterium]|nr:ADP-ribosylglycohydrolase family protein [Anaerolineales bacterium]
MDKFIPKDYEERVYAGVLGKIIGVYLGRPFEGWTYERIMRTLGEVTYYVNEKVSQLAKQFFDMDYHPPLVITDDDITGTFTFLRALSDYENARDLTPAQIGQTWLNYIIENRTILWWGGLGNSTEHTAYLRLKNGIQAPESGSIGLNGRIIAEQIGAQIFIDGWAMVAPGDPALAADLARRAASVSHDGEAIYAAQVLAAMEAQAFVESDIQQLIDTGLSCIPNDSIIFRMIEDIREWHAVEPDWHKTRTKIADNYGYDKYGGNVHVVPNHALIILGFLYGNDDFQESMKVVNTAGWDTDCNSGNLGCLLGIKNGLTGLECGPDWRGPVADRLYLPAADSGRGITDALIESYHIVNMGRALVGEAAVAPKGGARFHFNLPGSIQGWHPWSAESNGGVKLENVPGHSQRGERTLALRIKDGRVAAATPTFILPEELEMVGYALVASPTLYSGQLVRVGLCADRDVKVVLFVRVYDEEDALTKVDGPEIVLEPDEYAELEWRIPDTGGQPIAEIGLECQGDPGCTVYLDYVTWDGVPNVRLTRPVETPVLPLLPPQVWRRAWVNGVDQWDPMWTESYRLVQNSGRGLIMQGTREWNNYAVQATIKVSLVKAAGIGARVQGMRRYYALLLVEGEKLCLIKALDGEDVLGEVEFQWEMEKRYALRLEVEGNHLRGWVDGELMLEAEDKERPLLCGAAAYVVEEGHMMSEAMLIEPISKG